MQSKPRSAGWGDGRRDLMRPRVLVCAPLTQSFVECRANSQLRGFLEHIYSVLEDAHFSVVSAHRAENWGTLTSQLSSEEIARRDLAWVASCQALVAVLSVPGQREPWRTDGTFIEMGYALGLAKPIVLVGDLVLYRSLLVQGLSSIGKHIRLFMPELVLDEPSELIHHLVSLPTIAGLCPTTQLSREDRQWRKSML